MSLCTILCPERSLLALLHEEIYGQNLLFHTCFGQAKEGLTNVEYHQDAIACLLVPAFYSHLDIIFN